MLLFPLVSSPRGVSRQHLFRLHLLLMSVNWSAFLLLHREETERLDLCWVRFSLVKPIRTASVTSICVETLWRSETRFSIFTAWHEQREKTNLFSVEWSMILCWIFYSNHQETLFQLMLMDDCLSMPNQSSLQLMWRQSLKKKSHQKINEFISSAVSLSIFNEKFLFDDQRHINSLQRFQSIINRQCQGAQQVDQTFRISYFQKKKEKTKNVFALS